MRVAFLGPAGTYSHEALLRLPAAEKAELVPATSIREGVLAVRDGEVDAALVPLENAIEGSVHTTLDTLTEDAPGVSIRAELRHPIHHCLLGRGAAALSEVTRVLSHPQALAQSAGYLRRALPEAPTQITASTAEAVREVAEGPEAGPRAVAIGSRAAARRFGLDLWATDVEDDPGNETRFAWLSRDGGPAPEPAPDTGYKTAVVWWGGGPTAPGWLVRCLSEFAFRGVNLTRIESRPRRTAGLGEYLFYADADGATAEAPVAEAIEAIGWQAEGIRVLGSFPVASAHPPGV